MGTGVEDKGDGAVNRYALDQLPSEVERIAEWVRSTVASVTGEFSEWSDEERERLRPGCQLLVEIVDGELDDARGDFQALQAFVTTGAQVLLEQERTRHRRVSQVEADQAHWREQIRAVIRGYLREVVNISRALGVTDEDLPTLLADAAIDHDRAPGANVFPMASARARRGRRPYQ
jgi:hypothetical protein